MSLMIFGYVILVVVRELTIFFIYTTRTDYAHNFARWGDTIVDLSSQYHYSDQVHWHFSPVNRGSSHSGSLSSLFNPSSSGYSSRHTPTINTSYTSKFLSIPIHNNHNASLLSSYTRPTTGYLMLSISFLLYEEHKSSHHLGAWLWFMTELESPS